MSSEPRADPALPETVEVGKTVAAPPEGSGRPGARALATRFAIVAVLVGLDLWSKAAVFRWLGAIESRLEPDAHGLRRYPLLGDWLAFALSRNRGAAFGKLADWPHLLVVGRVLAALFLIVLIVRTPRRRGVFVTALVLILGGALGNLYDNLFLPPPAGHPYGAVRDFIDVYFAVWEWHFPTFNVADSCISVGAVLLLLSGFTEEGRVEDRASA